MKCEQCRFNKGWYCNQLESPGMALAIRGECPDGKPNIRTRLRDWWEKFKDSQVTEYERHMLSPHTTLTVPKGTPPEEVEKIKALWEKTELPTAEIESFIHDQGGGWSWCSSCQTKLDLDKVSLTMQCPNTKCNRQLIWGETRYNTGGSDF